MLLFIDCKGHYMLGNKWPTGDGSQTSGGNRNLLAMGISGEILKMQYPAKQRRNCDVIQPYQCGVV